MASSPAHQALFGYAKGHRLLASSRPLDGETGRTLRAATDAAFDGVSDRYLTVLPLPEIRAQAFIRTWPAPEWVRPGSVWSHVVLVDFVDLGNMVSLFGVLEEFRRPRTHGTRLDPDELLSYSQPLLLTGGDSNTAATIEVDLAAEVLSQVYGQSGRIIVAVDEPAAAEPTLLALYEQQWPRLRRHFAFRTRRRTSEGATNYDLDVVERSSRVSASENGSSPWVRTLVRDLAHRAPSLRQFLRTFGAESENGRRDMSAFVTLHDALVGDSQPSEVVATLCASFPAPRQLGALKRTLLGPDELPAWLGSTLWPKTEAQRLSLLFAATVSGLDYHDLDVPDRLRRLGAKTPERLWDVLTHLQLDRLSTDQVTAILNAVVDVAPVDAAAALAQAQPDLGLLLVARRPEALARPELWSAIDPELLLDVYSHCTASQQTAIVDGLVGAEAAGPVAKLCALDPGRWWDLLLRVARGSRPTTALNRDAQVLRRVLAHLGAAAIGAPVTPPNTQPELVALLQAADLSVGLWRHVPAETWLRLCEQTGTTSPTDATEAQVRQRIAAVALVAGSSGGNSVLRHQAWSSAFSLLHQALKDPEFDMEAWILLSEFLPAGPDWDRCYRLRQGAVAEIRRDKWSGAEAATLLDAAGPYRHEMQEALAAVKARKKSKGWLRELVDYIMP